MSDSFTLFRDVRKNSPMKGLARSVHLILASHANRFGMCWPSQQTIAEEAGCTVRYVKKVIGALVKQGLVEVYQDAEDGRRNKYRVFSCSGNRGTVEQEIGELEDRDRGTMSPLPIYRQEDHEGQGENQKTSGPAVRREETKVIGEIPEDEPNAPPERRGFPLTHTGTVAYFRNEARKQFADGDTMRVHATMKRMHKGMGLSWDQIQGIVRLFFTKYDLEIRAKRNEYSAIALFQQNLQRLVNQNPRPITEQSITVRQENQAAKHFEAWKRQRHA